MSTFFEKLNWFFARRDIKKIVRELGDDRNEILNLQKDDLWKLHRELGLTLRNSFRKGSYLALFSYSSRLLKKRGEQVSFDNISSVACERILEEFQNQK